MKPPSASPEKTTLKKPSLTRIKQLLEKKKIYSGNDL